MCFALNKMRPLRGWKLSSSANKLSQFLRNTSDTSQENNYLTTFIIYLSNYVKHKFMLETTT